MKKKTRFINEELKYKGNNFLFVGGEENDTPSIN